MEINIEELKRLINLGYTIDKLSEVFNVSIATIKRRMYKNGFKSISKKVQKIENRKKGKCAECGSDFNYDNTKRIRKFCSKNCILKSNYKIIKENREKISDKISKKLQKNEKYGECKCCKKYFIKRNKNTKSCSRSCSSKLVQNRPEVKKKASERFSTMAKLRYTNGDTSIGWKIRNNLKPSYPEQLTINFLNYRCVEFERELKVSKYFIDFAFIDKKIALEIDGRTHNDCEVIEKDKRKDECLKLNGWEVFRIKWINDKKHSDRLNSFIVQFGLEQ